MNKSWAGPAITGMILVGIGLFLFLNLENRKQPERDSVAKGAAPGQLATPEPVSLGTRAPVREYPIGDEVERNQIRVAAVWLPAVMMDDMSADPSMPMIHIEADVKALANNPNGFAKDEKVDYLKIIYRLVVADSGTLVATGQLIPMMARDGFHYGATIAQPHPGTYRLIYAIHPPSALPAGAGGMGRHSDPATGIAPWWEPFEASFDWTVELDDAKVTSR